MSADTDRFVDWLARELAARGTRFAFGVPGGGVTLDLLAATQATGIRTVITAREDAAAMMAGVAREAGGRSRPRVLDERSRAGVGNQWPRLGASRPDAGHVRCRGL